MALHAAGAGVGRPSRTFRKSADAESAGLQDDKAADEPLSQTATHLDNCLAEILARSRGEAKENDAGGLLPGGKDELAEVFVLGEKHATLLVGESKDVRVFRLGRGLGHRDDVIPLGAKCSHRCIVAALVGDKADQGVQAEVLALVRRTTSSWATVSAA